MLLIDIDDVRNSLPGVIAHLGRDYKYEKPEFAGGSCVYVDESGCPSCLVGQYLIKELKVPVDFFLKGGKFAEDELNYRDFDNITGQLYNQFGISFTKEANHALITIQDAQDTGYTWGNAYDLVFGEK